MAKGKTGGRGLSLTAKLNVAEAMKSAQALKKELAAIGGVTTNGSAKAFDVKPLTEYQAGLLKIKQEAADAAKARQDQAAAEKKAKQDQVAADKSASLVMQKALAEERLARQAVMLTTAKNRLEMQEATKLAREQAAAVKKLNEEYAKNKPVKNRDFSIEAQSQNASSKANALYTSTITSRVVADAKLTTELAKQAAVQNNLTAINLVASNATTASTAATNANVQSKKQLAQQLILEKATQQAAQSALKAYTLEQAAAKGSTEQRKLALDRLRLAYSQLNEQERNSPAGTRLATIIRGVTDQVKNLELATKGSVAGLKAQEGMFTSLKSQLLGVAAGYASLAAAAAAAKAVVHTNAEVSDSMADVQRTAKLTADQTDDLADSLKKLDRRTNLTSLLDIGYIGGQLGVGKNDIQGYIEKIDELGVVLKKEFPGGAEAVAVSLGKLNSIYKITASEGITLEQSLSKIGSALLGIAHDGPVNVQYLQDFALRTAGAAQVAKLSLPTMLAYGAVLSEAGVTAQVASSSVNRLVSSLSGKREKYLAIAQLADSSLTIEKFTKLINTDTKAALDLFFKGLKSGNPTQTEFNDRMSTLNFKVGAATNSITALALNQDKLSRKVSIGNEEYEKATLSAENFAIKNNTLAASMDKVGNAISNITTDPNSGIGKSIKFILDAVTDAIHALDNLMGRMSRYKSSYDDFFDRVQMAIINDPEASARVNERKQIKSQLAYKSLIEANRDQVVAQGTIKAKDIIDKNATEAALKSALKIEEGLLKSYFKQRDAAVAYFTNPENKDQALLAVAEKKAKDLQATLLRQKTSVDLLRNAYKGKYGAVQKQEGQDEESPLGRTIDVIKADIKRVMDLKKPLDTASKQYKDYLRQLGVLKKELKVANGGVDNSGRNEENSRETILKSRNTLQREIQVLINDSTKKQLAADDAEVQSVTEKYDKMREKAIEFNNSSKAKKFGLSTDIGSLAKAEKSEVQVVINKQSNDRLKAQLADEAKDFEAFEQYKTQYGQLEAEKRFKNQFTTAEAYGQKLENLQTKLLSEITDPADATESQKEQLDIITDAIKQNAEKRKSIDDATYANAYEAAKTYIQKAQEIENDYQRDKLALGEMATTEQIANLSKLRDARIRSINEERVYASSGYEELMMHYDEMTRKQISNKLDAIREGYRKEYAEGVLINGKLVKLTAEQLSRLLSGINQEQSKLEGDNPFSRIISAIRTYTDAVRDLGKNSVGAKNAQSEMFSAIAAGAAGANEMLGSVANGLDKLGVGGEGTQEVFKSVMGVVDGAGELAKGIASGNPVAIVTGSIKLLTSAVELFNTKDRKLEKQIKRYQADLSSLGKAYKQLERDVQDSVGNDIYSNQSAEIANLQQQQQKLIAIRNAESQKKKSDANKINDLNNQIDDIPNKIADINAAISQNLIQGTFRELSTSLANALTSGFKAGEDGITSMNKTFDDFIANAIQNSLKLTLLEPVVAQFTKELTEYAKGNGNTVLGFDFEAWKKKLDAAGKSFNEGLEASKDFFKGEDTTKEEASPNSLKGAYATASQESITLLAGQTSGMRIAQIETNNLLRPIGKSMGELFNIAKDSFDIAVKTERNTFKTANNTDRLENIETQLIQMNRKIGNSANAAKTAGF